MQNVNENECYEKWYLCSNYEQCLKKNSEKNSLDLYLKLTLLEVVGLASNRAGITVVAL